MIASLPMYDFPEIRHATDSLWQGISRHLRNQGIKQVPGKLAHDHHLRSLWSDDHLFFSQCCGYDVIHRYKDRLQVLGTPWFAATGCCNGDYASTIVVPEDSTFHDVVDMLGTVAVLNGPESHSGMNALFSLVAPYSRKGRFFSEVKISGSHAASLEALKKGSADVASVDCLTYDLLRRYRPGVITGTRTLGLTYPAPAPPYVTRKNADPETVARMKMALREAFSDSNLSQAMDALRLSDIEITDSDPYQRIVTEFGHNLQAV